MVAYERTLANTTLSQGAAERDFARSTETQQRSPEETCPAIGTAFTTGSREPPVAIGDASSEHQQAVLVSPGKDDPTKHTESSKGAEGRALPETERPTAERVIVAARGEEDPVVNIPAKVVR